MRDKNRNRLLTTRIAAIIVIAGLAFIGVGCKGMMTRPNVTTPKGGDYSIYIPTGASFNQVKDTLYAHGLIIDKKSFETVASLKKCDEHVHPGRYILKNGMSNKDLCNMLRGGLQTPVKVTFNNIRDVKMLAGRIGEQIEADSTQIADYLNNTERLSELGFTPQTLPAMFLPNTYEFYWNTDASHFVSRMKTEYDKFWNDERREKAQALGLTPVQVSILASIVDKETNKTDEMARIAGVYMNRLKSGWLLQADPTLVFAVGDFSLKRVLNVHKEVDSPYNTYKYHGLPPGPICIPSLASINAVLNAEKHNYFYFCAKEDFSGYHVFAKTLTEHNRNAQRYQHALSRNL